MINAIKEHFFLFSELVKRDFKKKYKRTYLGIFWSVLAPLLTLLIMKLVFTNFFGKDIPNYTTYLFCGNVIFAFFSDAANGGMMSIVSNSSIFTKVKVPKYLFLLSRETTALINFGLTFLVFLLFCIIDGVAITPLFLMLIIPVICLVIFNLGVGLILSTMFVFFRDMQYLWGIFNTLLTYVSVIFYSVDVFDEKIAALFHLNPVYVYIKYFRLIVLEGKIPSLAMHALAIGYALLFLAIGALVYKRNNQKFVYYV